MKRATGLLFLSAFCLLAAEFWQKPYTEFWGCPRAHRVIQISLAASNTDGIPVVQAL